MAKIHELYEGRIACASGADRFKVELQLGKCRLMPYFKRRISEHELPRSNPAPDVYLTAAVALGVDAKRCAVLEGTVTGGHDWCGARGVEEDRIRTGFVDMTELPEMLN